MLPENYSNFMAELDKLNANYNAGLCAIDAPFSSPGYHTTLKSGVVHSTRTSFSYAVALLDSGVSEYVRRATDVLEGVIALQDRDPSNPTYGIWSWFYEEPLSMMSPPDWNWADFCGKEMLMAVRFHKDKLPAGLIERIENSLRCACMSIFRRNMHSAYTNISIMGSFVTMCAGEEYGWTDMFEYGKSRFKKFCDFTRANSAFAEYNSPTYTVVAIEDLTRIHCMVHDEEVRARASEMLDIGWGTLATHFHAPTKQWAGPHGRAYQWIQGNHNLSLVQLATHGKVQLVAPEELEYDVAWAHLDFECPEKYHSMFTECVPHSANCRYGAMDALLRPVSVPDVATCYLTPKFALGSFERSDTWNQHRNLLGYWGGAQPRFMACRLLHDFYDFSSGMLAISQCEGNALIAASLVTDGGDTHCNLDMVKQQTIRACDLRLRIELGNLSRKPVLNGDTVTIDDGDMKLQFKLIGGDCDGHKLAISTACSDDIDVATTLAAGQERRVTPAEARREYVDVVFYTGPEAELHLDQFSAAYAVVALSMDAKPEMGDCLLNVNADTVSAMAICAGHELKVIAPARPVKRVFWRANAFADGVDVDMRD